MSMLSPEERRRIYEEEKARIGARSDSRRSLLASAVRWIVFIVAISVVGFLVATAVVGRIQ